MTEGFNLFGHFVVLSVSLFLTVTFSYLNLLLPTEATFKPFFSEQTGVYLPGNAGLKSTYLA